MSLGATVKKVPKWAWIASAGIVGGVVVMRMRSAKAGTQTTTADSSDATAAGDYGLGASAFPSDGVVSAGGASDGSDDSSAPIDIAGIVTAAISAIPDHTQDILDANAAAEAGWQTVFANLPGMAGGGGAPSSGTTGANPDTSGQSNPPIDNGTPAAPPAATVTPPVTVKPTVVSQTHQCPGDYPKGTYPNCYREEVSHGPSASNGNKKAGTWHVYKDHNVYMGA